MPKISSYPSNSDPDDEFEFLGTDPENTSEAASGTTETVPLSAIVAAVPQATSSAYGTVKLSGSSSQYLNGAGSWTTPSGGGGGVPGMQVFYMDANGADHTGTTSCTSIFNAAVTAAAGGPLLVVFGLGTYLFSTAPSSLGKDQSVAGLGSRVTTFTWSGSGPLFTVTEAVTGGWNGSDRAGALTGFSISGPGGSSGTAGVKYGALQGLRLDDLGLYGLDGGAVIGYAVSTNDWAEEAIMTRLDISECGATSGNVFSFTGTSFDYSSIDALVVVEHGIDVIALDNAVMEGLQLGLRGNLHGGATNTGALISMDRADSSYASVIGGGSFMVGMEGDDTTDGGSGTVGHYLIYMNSTSSASQFEAQGSLNVFNAGAAGQFIYNPNFLPLSFTGLLNSGTSQMLDGEAGVVYGGQALTAAGMGFTTLGTGTQTLYIQFGDVMSFTLSSGSTTLAMSENSAFVRRLTFLIKQPASGTATLTWPASFYFASGSSLSTAAGAIDQVSCVWDPSSAVYYCTVTGKAYAHANAPA